MITKYPSISVVTPLIEMFGVCPSIDIKFDIISLNKNAMSKGYIVEPSAANIYSNAYINSIDIKYNSTFYKTWSDVTNKTRFQLLVDQLMHYMSTYGTDFNAIPYIDNTNPEDPEWTSYKLIHACSFSDLYDKCMNMLNSGVALKSETVKIITDFIVEYCNINNTTPDVDTVNNREALVILCDKLNILPKDGNKLFAHIVYKTTGETMIIKNRELRVRIENYINFVSDKADIWKSLKEEHLISLSSVFNRYKPLFLAFKTSSTKTIINKISRLSKKHHKPMKRGFWETILNKDYKVFKQLPEQLEKASNFKLIQVMQSIRERLILSAGQGDNMYIVRNGKVFVKSNDYSALDSRYAYWEDIYNECKAQLVKNLSAKACKVKFPSQYVLTCPTSEKNFIGNFPMGTHVSMGPNSVMGIYWRNDWGTNDFDLSFISIYNTKIGWNSSFYDEQQNIIYSGDMTDATDGANEVLFFKNKVTDGIVYVNRYNGTPNSKYKIYFGTDKYDNYMKFLPVSTYYSKGTSAMANYMVDPNNVQLQAEINQGEMNQQMVGVIIDGKFYFYSLSCGYSTVSAAISLKNSRNKNSKSNIVEIMKRKANMFIPLKEILLEAGFKEVKSNKCKNYIDLTEINRDTLIDLFSKK